MASIDVPGQFQWISCASSIVLWPSNRQLRSCLGQEYACWFLAKGSHKPGRANSKSRSRLAYASREVLQASNAHLASSVNPGVSTKFRQPRISASTRIPVYSDSRRRFLCRPAFLGSCAYFVVNRGVHPAVLRPHRQADAGRIGIVGYRSYVSLPKDVTPRAPDEMAMPCSTVMCHNAPAQPHEGSYICKIFFES